MASVREETAEGKWCRKQQQDKEVSTHWTWSCRAKSVYVHMVRRPPLALPAAVNFTSLLEPHPQWRKLGVEAPLRNEKEGNHWHMAELVMLDKRPVNILSVNVLVQRPSWVTEDPMERRCTKILIHRGREMMFKFTTTRPLNNEGINKKNNKVCKKHISNSDQILFLQCKIPIYTLSHLALTNCTDVTSSALRPLKPG